MTYVDGTLTPVRTGRHEAYRELLARVAEVHRESGAVRAVDCCGPVADEAREGFHAEGARGGLGEDGPPFRQAAGAGDREVVVLSWTEWPDKATRDAGLARVMGDPRIQPRKAEEPIFKGRRLIAGGFEMILDASARTAPRAGAGRR